MYKGDISLINKNQLAIVGPRKSSLYGTKVAEYFSKQLAPHFVITSGLADGIDAAAHKQCLTDKKATIAVIGTGLNIAYPNKHFKLQEDISRNGLVLSEFPLHTSPLKQHFPQRNRIISGLSKGVIVCEASLKSGSLITANFALEQNKEVYAVPGPIFNETSKGVHKLIQDGAKCTQDVNDIFEDFNISSIHENAKLFDLTEQEEVTDTLPLTGDENVIFSILNDHLMSLEDLLTKSSFSIHKLLPLLSMLEIKGLITQHPGKNYSKK